MTAVFTWPVAYGTSEEVDLGIKRIKLGEGYSQRRQELINPVKPSWPIRIKRKLSEIAVIRQFIETNGCAGFDWVPPGRSAAVRVTCDNAKITYPSFDVGELTATFILEYEP